MHHEEIRQRELQVLEERGIKLEEGQTFTEVVAVTLRVPKKQSEAFLEAIYNGATVEQAASAAGLDLALLQNEAMIDAAQAIAAALCHSRESV
jgi:hypothetical protein